MLKIRDAGIVRLAQNSYGFGKRCNEMLIEQDAGCDPVLEAATGAIR